MRLSYSLIKTFYQCKHKFYHQFVLGKRTSNIYTILGEYVHSIIEKCLKDNNVSYLEEANKVYDELYYQNQCYVTIYNEILDILNNSLIDDIKDYIGESFISEYKYRIHTDEYRISAIADVLVKREDGYEIIDFKTSKAKRKKNVEISLDSYNVDYLQLYIYAYIIGLCEEITVDKVTFYMLRDNRIFSKNIGKDELSYAKEYLLQAMNDIRHFYTLLESNEYSFDNEGLCEYCKPYGYCKFNNTDIL